MLHVFFILILSKLATEIPVDVLRDVKAALQGTLQSMHISNVCDVRDVCICSW